MHYNSQSDGLNYELIAIGGAEFIWNYSKGMGQVSTAVAMGTLRMLPLCSMADAVPDDGCKSPAKVSLGRENVHAHISD